MPPAAGPVLACAFILVSAQANAQAGATPPPPAHQEVEPQRPAADLHVDGDKLAGFVAATGAHGDDLSLRWLFLGGVRMMPPADFSSASMRLTTTRS
jgi:hypothetical protein